MNLKHAFSRPRFIVILVLLCVLALAVFARLIYLNTFQRSFLMNQIDYQSIHYRPIYAARGMILDRNGVPLAVSAPLDDLIGDPKTLLEFPNEIPVLAASPVINLPEQQLMSMLLANPKSRYLVLRKNLPPQVAQQVMALRIPGVAVEVHYTSYYPMGAPLAPLIGFTNINNQGQSGLELAFNKTLSDTTGREAVLRNARGRVISVVKVIKPAQDGKTVTLSIDSRIQYLAYQALAAQVQKVHAENGSVVVTDPYTGEILAAASYPSFNPNNVNDRVGANVKDRAVTDTFEPGSTMKVFSIAAALTHGQYTPTTPIDTRPGWILLDGHRVHDDQDNGLTDVTGVLKYSSNVGVSKIVLSQPWSYTYDMITGVGFGSLTGVEYPGESSGIIHPLSHLSKLEFANMAFGYHIAVTTLQMARAYDAVANGGMLYPLTFVKRTTPPQGVRVMPEKVAEEMRVMMHTVVEAGGTGTRADIKGYETAGKTGTTNLAGPHGYYQNRYNAMFAAIVPVNHPKIVVIIHVTDPKGWIFQFGGQTSAPIYAEIAPRILALLGVPPSHA